jgi:hypothetical protein
MTTDFDDAVHRMVQEVGAASEATITELVSALEAQRSGADGFRLRLLLANHLAARGMVPSRVGIDQLARAIVSRRIVQAA